MLLSYTGSQLTEGFRRLYQEKAAETNSADFAAVLPRNFCERYQEEIAGFRQAEEEILVMETSDALLLRHKSAPVFSCRERKDACGRSKAIFDLHPKSTSSVKPAMINVSSHSPETSDALLLRNMDIQAGNREPVNGSWMIRAKGKMQTTFSCFSLSLTLPAKTSLPPHFFEKVEQLLFSFFRHRFKEWGKYPSQISGGQMGRAGIVRALINNPEVVFADEPTGALADRIWSKVDFPEPEGPIKTVKSL